MFGITIQGENEDIAGVAEEVGNFCGQWQGRIRQVYYVSMAVEEICMTIVRQQAKEYFYRNHQGFNSLVVRI